MKKLSILPLIIRYWRYFLIVFCICFGSGLIYSTKHLLPIFADVVTVNLQDAEQADHSSPRFPVKKRESKSDHLLFLPIVSTNETAVEAEQNNHPETQVIADIEIEDFSLDLKLGEGSPPITLIVDPKEKQFQDVKPVELKFLPGKHCEFGDGHACVYEFNTSSGSQVTFISIHSGLGGEGDGFRNLIEGTGINQGLFTSSQVLDNIQLLSGSEIRLGQGDKKISGLTLINIVRVPPERIKDYISLPVEQSFSFAMKLGAMDLEKIKEDLLVIETCGWRLPDEEPVEGLEDMSSSVYVAVIEIKSPGNDNQ